MHMCKNKGPSHSLCAVPKPSEMLNTANVRRAAIQAEASVGRSWSCTFLPGALDPKTQAALQAGALEPWDQFMCVVPVSQVPTFTK